MDVRTRFAALEMAYREQARVAQNDVRYWLNEADEWAHLKEKAAGPMIESPPLQLELLRRDFRQSSGTVSKPGEPDLPSE